ncbi:hypothetical protein [Roseomonas sp. USHLN139]|uniref:hypothetical protein n=1 Tax=Roseomonas sp. USHLN139 TaxID=3081298 RepID=UPI003B01C038
MPRQFALFRVRVAFTLPSGRRRAWSCLVEAWNRPEAHEAALLAMPRLPGAVTLITAKKETARHV